MNERTSEQRSEGTQTGTDERMSEGASTQLREGAGEGTWTGRRTLDHTRVCMPVQVLQGKSFTHSGPQSPHR